MTTMLPVSQFIPRLVVASISLALLGGCGSTVTGSPEAAPTASLTNTTTPSGSFTTPSNTWTSPAPCEPFSVKTDTPKRGPFRPDQHPPANCDNDGTPFDPCLAYTPQEIHSWGVNPNQVTDTAVSLGGSLRGCDWDGTDYLIYQTVTDAPVKNYLVPGVMGRTNPKPLTVGGRDAAQFQLGDDNSCAIVLPSRESVVIVGLILTDKGKEKYPSACPKALEIATYVVTKIP